MIKLLNTKTGNIFVLPDVDAMKIKAEDRSNTYRVLDAGLLETKEEQISQKEVEEVIQNAEERAEQIEEEDKEQELKEQEEEQKNKEGKINENPRLPKVTEDTLDLDKINKKELVNMAKRLGLNANINEAKQAIIDRIKNTGIL